MYRDTLAGCQRGVLGLLFIALPGGTFPRNGRGHGAGRLARLELLGAARALCVCITATRV